MQIEVGRMAAGVLLQAIKNEKERIRSKDTDWRPSVKAVSIVELDTVEKALVEAISVYDEDRQ